MFFAPLYRPLALQYEWLCLEIKPDSSFRNKKEILLQKNKQTSALLNGGEKDNLARIIKKVVTTITRGNLLGYFRAKRKKNCIEIHYRTKTKQNTTLVDHKCKKMLLFYSFSISLLLQFSVFLVTFLFSWCSNSCGIFNLL